MAEILNELNAREAARALAKRNQEQIAIERQSVQNWLKGVSEATGEEDDFTEIAALLALPEDQFMMLAPVFLEEIEKSYNDPRGMVELAKLLNIQEITVEELEEQKTELYKLIDGEVGESLSKQKRDFLKEMVGTIYNAVSGAEGIAKKVISIPIELCDPNAKLPVYAHETDAGLDLYALEDITIAPGETKLIKTGIKVAIPRGYEIQVRPKSGRCLKTKLRVANTPGTIDAGYRDEIGVIIDNIDPPIRAIHPNQFGAIDESSIEYGQSYTIGKGEKFAQLVLSEVPKICWMEVDSVSNIGEDRKGGFGSTGLK